MRSFHGVLGLLHLDCYTWTVTRSCWHCCLGNHVSRWYWYCIGTVTVTFVVGVSSIVGVSMVDGHHHQYGWVGS